MIPIPRKLAARGVTDMLRISDGRMSGTAGGTIVLHISPESAIPGSPFGVVRSGDLIVFDAEKRILRVDISDEELQARIEQRRREIVDTSHSWEERQTRRGYWGLYQRTVNQAHEGADFDFLTATGLARVVDLVSVEMYFFFSFFPFFWHIHYIVRLHRRSTRNGNRERSYSAL